MSGIIQPNFEPVVIRGAITSDGNTEKEIESAVIELIKELLSRNHINSENILSITFTVTKDLDACFPAAIARKYFRLDKVAFLDCQQMFVPDDVKYCIRLMALIINKESSIHIHPYLKGASKLRPDRC